MSKIMPSLRKKVAEFIRQLSVTNQAENVLSDSTDSARQSSGCFIQRYLSGHDVREQPEPLILHGRNPHELPSKPLGALVPQPIFAALTGPDGGLTTVNRHQRHLSTSDPDVDYIDIQDNQQNVPPNNLVTTSSGEKRHKANGDKSQQRGEGEIAGVLGSWQRGHSRAWGAATTLYERHPLTGQHAGSPIADCFAVVARSNSAILALADGVNWGEKACVAARSAVHGCIDYLNKAIFGPAAVNVSNTTEVFVSLLRSFHAAHSLILQEAGMLTTLTAALVLPLTEPDRYIVCVCNVGDSLAYVYSPQHGVREITKGSHDIHCMRDMRDALGALGPVDGQNPELNNLTCSMTEVKPGDIVFLTSDGVSDNFDPVVGKFAVLPPSADNGNLKGSLKPVPAAPPSPKDSHPTLPTVQAYQRHELSLLRMDDLLRNGVSGNDPPCKDAQTLCDMLLDFATRLTAAKRHILEDRDLYCTTTGEEVTELSRGEQRARRRKVCEKLAMVPGKLDHATVVAYQVGLYQGENEERGEAALNDDMLIETVL